MIKNYLLEKNRSISTVHLFRMLSEPNIEALIHLIDDPDDSIFQHVRDRLLLYGPDAIPFLENSWEEKDFGLIFHNRIEDLIHDIQFEDIKSQLTHWTTSEKDLFEGALIIAKYQYPGLDEEAIKGFIEEIRKDIWLELNPRQTAFEKVKVFNKIFFDRHRFHGDTKHFHSPLNSYINTVLESRKGNPLSLCIIYSIIAQSLELPIYGVNLPNHFVLAYMDEDGTNMFIPDSSKYGILFYINVFGKGGIFDEAAVDTFLKGLNLPKKRQYYEPCSNTDILYRMLINLISSFQEVGNAEKVDELLELKAILKKY